MLLIPGPVDVPEVVLQASAYVQNHRSGEFREIVRKASDRLNALAGSKHSLMTTGSGTTAVESIVYSMVSPGEKVLSVSFGEFGNRLIESLNRRGAEAVPLIKDHDGILEPGEISDIVRRDPGISAVFLVHNETGNGTSIRNLRRITEEASGLGLKVLVDSVSGFGGSEIKTDEWGIHAFASCSQKGLASVPGLGIVCIGESGEKYVRDAKDMPLYLDLGKSISFMGKDETPYTPSTGSFAALLTALMVLENEGPEQRWRRHEACSSFLRKQLADSGFELYGNGRNYSSTVVAFNPGRPASEVVKGLASRDIVVSRGIGKEAESMIRAGILGMVDSTRVSAFLNGLWQVLGMDRKIEPDDFPADARIDPSIFDVDEITASS